MGFTMKDMMSMKGVLIKGRVLALRELLIGCSSARIFSELLSGVLPFMVFVLFMVKFHIFWSSSCEIQAH